MARTPSSATALATKSQRARVIRLASLSGASVSPSRPIGVVMTSSTRTSRMSRPSSALRIENHILYSIIRSVFSQARRRIQFSPEYL